MTGTPDEERRTGTHVGEWADLVGDDVPESALRERTLGDPLRAPREDDRDRDGPAGAS